MTMTNLVELERRWTTSNRDRDLDLLVAEFRRRNLDLPWHVLAATKPWRDLVRICNFVQAEPLGPQLACDPKQLCDVEEQFGRRLPERLREWFQLCGTHFDVFSDHLTPLEFLVEEAGKLGDFWSGDQSGGTFHFGSPPYNEDPELFYGENNEEGSYSGQNCSNFVTSLVVEDLSNAMSMATNFSLGHFGESYSLGFTFKQPTIKSFKEIGLFESQYAGGRTDCNMGYDDGLMMVTTGVLTFWTTKQKSDYHKLTGCFETGFSFFRELLRIEDLSRLQSQTFQVRNKLRTELFESFDLFNWDDFNFQTSESQLSLSLARREGAEIKLQEKQDMLELLTETLKIEFTINEHGTIISP